MPRYLMRFDDINSRMDWKKFFIIKKKLEKYNIKSILGVVPNCKDKNLTVCKPHKNYFEYLRYCKNYGDAICQHGYQHIYDSQFRGKFGSSNNSEFAGNSFEDQFIKLKKGKKILERESLWQPVFMAPAHSFDSNTIKALKKLYFDTLLDGFSLFPYKENGIKFIPQISSKPLPFFVPGLSQLCVHVNTMNENELNKLLDFIDNYHSKFIDLNNILVVNNGYTKFDKSLVFIFIKIFRFIKFLFSNIKKFYYYFRCFIQRFFYKIKYINIEIYDWHLKGTFYCRKYKILALRIVEDLNPNIFIDIGCGLGEILSKVSLDVDLKLGFDNDKRLSAAHNLTKNLNFRFFRNQDSLFAYAKNINIKKDKLIVVSALNFMQNVSPEELKGILEEYFENLGEFILLIDSIYSKENLYKYNHHNFLFNHKGLIRYYHKIDNLRSLYCIKIG